MNTDGVTLDAVRMSSNSTARRQQLFEHTRYLELRNIYNFRDDDSVDLDFVER